MQTSDFALNGWRTADDARIFELTFSIIEVLLLNKTSPKRLRKQLGSEYAITQESVQELEPKTPEKVGEYAYIPLMNACAEEDKKKRIIGFD